MESPILSSQTKYTINTFGWSIIKFLIKSEKFLVLSPFQTLICIFLLLTVLMNHHLKELGKTFSAEGDVLLNLATKFLIILALWVQEL